LVSTEITGSPAAKTREGNQHPDRDAQFRYLSGQVNAFMAAACRL
jgi:hypothetical protein